MWMEGGLHGEKRFLLDIAPANWEKIESLNFKTMVF